MTDEEEVYVNPIKWKDGKEVATYAELLKPVSTLDLGESFKIALDWEIEKIDAILSKFPFEVKVFKESDHWLVCRPLAESSHVEPSAEVEWLEPSNVGAEYVRHSNAMRPCERVPVGKAFAVAGGFNVGLLRKIAESFEPKKIAVIDHGSGFEVRRLDDSENIGLFYASLEKPERSGSERLREILTQAFSVDPKSLLSYDPKIATAIENDCVTAGYISRRLSGTAFFRNSPKGGKVELKEAIEALIDEGILTKLDATETQAIIQSTAATYRVNRELL